jgi:hypothetical protein
MRDDEVAAAECGIRTVRRGSFGFTEKSSVVYGGGIALMDDSV